MSNNVKASTIAIGVDGSQHSILAAEEASTFLRERDHVLAIHVDDPEKDYLPVGFQVGHIQQDCQMLFGALPDENYTFIAPEIDEDELVHQIIVEVRCCCLITSFLLCFILITIPLLVLQTNSLGMYQS